LRRTAGAGLLHRKFIGPAPNSVRIGDINYVPARAGFLYLPVALDMAIGQRTPAAVIHHSDQGSRGEIKRPSQHLGRESCDG
jgi:hypothetical protein